MYLRMGRRWALIGGLGEPEAHGDQGEAEHGERGDRLREEQGAQPGGGDRAQREKDGHLGRRRMTEGPEPEEIADAAIEADEDDGQPPATGEVRHGREETLARGQDRKSTRLNSSHTVISYAVF